MDDLVTWLRAQLDEDERMIREYLGWWAANKPLPGAGIVVLPGFDAGEPMNPERALAEVDAKRRVLDLVTDSGPEWRDGYTEAYRDVIRLLALPYADRPGYRDDWRPAASR